MFRSDFVPHDPYELPVVAIVIVVLKLDGFYGDELKLQLNIIISVMIKDYNQLMTKNPGKDRILLVFFGIVCLLGSFGLFYRFMFNLRAEDIYEEEFR